MPWMKRRLRLFLAGIIIDFQKKCSVYKAKRINFEIIAGSAMEFFHFL